MYLSRIFTLTQSITKTVIKDGHKILEIGVEGADIVDFQTGDMSTEEIMEMYSDDAKK